MSDSTIKSGLAKMTPRQWSTYRVVEERMQLGLPCSQNLIFASYPKAEHEDGYVWNECAKHGDHCREIWDDVQAINESPEVDKIIVVRKYDYKLGTEEECERYFNWLRSKGLKLMQRAYAVLNKCSKDGQGKLLSNQLKEIEGNDGAKPFTESFFDYERDSKNEQ